MHKKPIILRNKDLRKVLMGIPRGHKHIRMIIKLSNGSVFVFHEATIASIVRAYINIITHPQRRAVELLCTELKERKEEFARYQLIESSKDEEAIINEITEVILS